MSFKLMITLAVIVMLTEAAAASLTETEQRIQIMKDLIEAQPEIDGLDTESLAKKLHGIATAPFAPIVQMYKTVFKIDQLASKARSNAQETDKQIRASIRRTIRNKIVNWDSVDNESHQQIMGFLDDNEISTPALMRFFYGTFMDTADALQIIPEEATSDMPAHTRLATVPLRDR